MNQWAAGLSPRLIRQQHIQVYVTARVRDVLDDPLAPRRRGLVTVGHQLTQGALDLSPQGFSGDWPVRLPPAAIAAQAAIKYAVKLAHRRSEWHATCNGSSDFRLS
ncbi:hypothetical protein MSAS_08790 [Mycobacterium saskatchewanense]|nr:hypothetical protein MSAS_08790 [Mycobacterium saskatchewanense]